MALPVHRAAVPSGAEGPKGRGRARKVQTDVPERIYRCGNPTRRQRENEKESRSCHEERMTTSVAIRELKL